VERFTAAEASRWALLRSTGRPAHQRASLIQLLYVDAAGFEILRAPRSSGLGELRRQRARMAPLLSTAPAHLVSILTVAEWGV